MHVAKTLERAESAIHLVMYGYLTVGEHEIYAHLGLLVCVVCFWQLLCRE